MEGRREGVGDKNSPANQVGAGVLMQQIYSLMYKKHRRDGSQKKVGKKGTKGKIMTCDEFLNRRNNEFAE